MAPNRTHRLAFSFRRGAESPEQRFPLALPGSSEGQQQQQLEMRLACIGNGMAYVDFVDARTGERVPVPEGITCSKANRDTTRYLQLPERNTFWLTQSTDAVIAYRGQELFRTSPTDVHDVEVSSTLVVGHPPAAAPPQEEEKKLGEHQ